MGKRQDHSDDSAWMIGLVRLCGLEKLGFDVLILFGAVDTRNNRVEKLQQHTHPFASFPCAVNSSGECSWRLTGISMDQLPFTTSAGDLLACNVGAGWMELTATSRCSFGLKLLKKSYTFDNWNQSTKPRYRHRIEEKAPGCRWSLHPQPLQRKFDKMIGTSMYSCTLNASWYIVHQAVSWQNMIETDLRV